MKYQSTLYTHRLIGMVIYKKVHLFNCCFDQQGSRGSSIVVEPINTGTAIVKATLKDGAFSVSHNHQFIPSVLHVRGCLFKLCVIRLNVV